jgi:hypothetical protein
MLPPAMTTSPTSATTPLTRQQGPITDVRSSRSGFESGSGTWVSAPSLAFCLLLLVLMAVGREKLFQDPGTFWHVALGQRLLADGELTRSDSLTFTFARKPWLSLQWLGEALMALAYQVGGWDTLLLLAAVVLAATYALLLRRLMRAGLHWLSAALAVAVVLAASSHHFHARPHLATIALLGLTMGWLCDMDAGRTPITRLFWLTPLLPIWANLHGGALGGWATVALAVALWWVQWLCFGRGPLRTGKDALLAAIAVMCLAGAMLANPYGLDMPRAWLRIMAMPLPDLIQEHRPLSLWRPEGFMVALLGLAYVGLLCKCWRNRGLGDLRVTWLLPLVWLTLAVLRVRHAPLFAITAGIALADILPPLWVARSEHGREGRGIPEDTPIASMLWGVPPENGSRSEPTTLVRCLRRALLPVALVSTAVLLQALAMPLPLFGRGWARHDPRQWPVELLPTLHELERQVPGAAVFNTLDYGGFLAFHAPRLKTFIDDRCELFGAEFLTAYAEAERHAPQRIDVWADEYGFHLALVRAGSPFDVYLHSSSQWRMLERSPAAVLYRRADERRD